ncbi:MAG: sulfite exporter TauE/SafE family protein [Hyphomicrobiales bacterium]|nr:MAG: sulfite exporter TauE/SafE family protein [Hyphomicrobiales bacterium]
MGIEFSLLPADLPPLIAVLLVVVSFFTSALSATFGLGGGVALLAVMASVMPALAIIPVHGVVQLGSNVGRAAVQARHVHRPLLLWFAVGAVFGAIAGGQVVFALPAQVLKLVVGLFILWTVWGSKPKLATAGPGVMAAGGFASTVLTMFVGATGPFIAALLAPQPLEKKALIGTHATLMSLQHALKVLAFGFLGFAFGPWIVLIAAMIGAGFLGTLFGSKLLDRMPEAAFRKGFRIVLALIALQLVVRAAAALLLP